IIGAVGHANPVVLPFTINGADRATLDAQTATSVIVLQAVFINIRVGTIRGGNLDVGDNAADPAAVAFGSYQSGMKSESAYARDERDMPLRPVGKHIHGMVTEVEIGNDRPATLFFQIAGQRPPHDVDEHLAVLSSGHPFERRQNGIA